MVEYDKCLLQLHPATLVPNDVDKCGMGPYITAIPFAVEAIRTTNTKPHFPLTDHHSISILRPHFTTPNRIHSPPTMSLQPPNPTPPTNTEISAAVLPTLFGWPTTGGVWVLKPTQEQFDAFNRNPATTDMDEHCRMLQQIGARFYSDPDQSEEARAAMGR